MKRIFYFLPAILIILLAGSCKKDSNTTPAATIINFTATLSGASETPANASAATGSSAGSYNMSTKILTLSTTYSGITVTAAHIHKGATGVSGPVEFPFSIGASPIVFTSSAFSDSDESDLLENKFYVNLHSAAYPGGEIRGQLTRQ